MKRIAIDVNGVKASDIARFQRKCERQPDGCLNWQGASNGKGYGRFKFKGKLLLAHRFAFAVANRSSPDVGVIDHICNNPKCVEPSHLRHVSYAFNTARGESKVALTLRRIASTGTCINGHPRTDEHIRHMPSGARCETCKRDAETKARQRPDVKARRAAQAKEYRMRMKAK